MKTRQALFLVTLLVTGCNGRHTSDENFTSKRISKTASFVVNEHIDNVFPLYGAFEERKWAPHWNPVLIYPEKEIMEEGTVFKVEAHGHGYGGEDDFLWIVAKYQPEDHYVQYLVSTENRFWTIDVKSESNGNDTKTTVTYTYTGLNDTGNKINQKSLEKMYATNLRDWADLINGYFKSVD